MTLTKEDGKLIADGIATAVKMRQIREARVKLARSAASYAYASLYFADGETDRQEVLALIRDALCTIAEYRIEDAKLCIEQIRLNWSVAQA